LKLKKIIKKIPFAKEVFYMSRYFFNDIKKSIEEKIFTNKKFFNLEEIKNRIGPVVLVSRPLLYSFSLSYAYLAGYLKQKGIDVIILFKNENFDDLAKKIISLNPILVGFGNLYPELEEIRSIIFKLNKLGRDFPIVIGGQMFSPIPEFVLKITGADYGVLGEGEVILYNLVKAIKDNKNIANVGGLVIREKEQIVFTQKGEYIDDLSKLPEIPYELFPTDEWLYVGRWYTKMISYVPHWRFNDKVINIHGGRGCPYNCNFCYHHSKPRYRDINIMMEEAEKSLEKFDANFLYFSDDLVIANPKRVKELIERIKKLKKPINYSISTRFDILERLDDSILQEMKATGCRIMGLGIESGSNRILKIIGKNTTSEKILIGLERLKKVQILPTVSVMIGQYTETKEDVLKSIELVKESVRNNPLINYAFTITTPFPGSELYKLIFDKGYLKNDKDFYKIYFKNGMSEWNQVVNLSDMTKEEIVYYRKEIERVFFDEKAKAFGLEKNERLTEIFNRQKSLAVDYDNKLIDERNKDKNSYETQQLDLEKQKLLLMGIK
jgi:anaerobic magnesium-protoporphyrin IX monomethyl ester cyclase